MALIKACPCCGTPVSAQAMQLEEEFRCATFGGRSVLLGPQRFAALALLRSTLPRPAYADWLAESLGVRRSRLRQIIWMLRADVAELGLEIKGLTGSDHYLLDVATDLASRRFGSRRRIPERAKKSRPTVCA